MATHTVGPDEVGAHRITLTANTIETVTFTEDLPNSEVISDGTAAVYYTLDGTTPTVGGNNCYVLPAGAACVDSRYVRTAGNTVVKLISTGTPTVSVQRGY